MKKLLTVMADTANQMAATMATDIMAKKILKGSTKKARNNDC